MIQKSYLCQTAIQGLGRPLAIIAVQPRVMSHVSNAKQGGAKRRSHTIECILGPLVAVNEANSVRACIVNQFENANSGGEIFNCISTN